MRVSHMKSLRDLSIIGLDTERSHAIGGEMVRVYFRVSSPPPLGWSYIFTTTWNTVVYPLKRPAGVESEAIWIDCIPEEVGTYHLERLEIAVAQTNAKYRDGARQQSANASHHAELEAQRRSKLRDLDQTLYPRSGGGQQYAAAIVGQRVPRKVATVSFPEQETEARCLS